MKKPSPLPDYREALRLLDTFSNSESTLPPPAFFRDGRDRMRRLLERLGQPHLGIPAVHIAGTKGKGSVTHLAGAVLTAAGFKTGLYTSPHVENLRERIGLDGLPIGERAFSEAAAEVLPEATAMREAGQAPSYFEVLTGIALTAFRNAGVEAMFLETGLGGRLDATNIQDLRLAAAGLTSISLDHEDILGHTLAEIAAEKAEIIRPGIPVATAPQAEEVNRVIRTKASDCQAPLLTVGREIRGEVRRRNQPDKPEEGQRLEMAVRRQVYSDIPLALPGRHQAENATLALGLADLLLEYLDREPPGSLILKRAWRELTLPARLEVVGRSPWRVVDGAHNPAAAWAAAETLGECFTSRNATLVFGVAADKNWRLMLRILLPKFRQAVFTPFNSPRSLKTGELSDFAAREFPGVGIQEAADPAQALDRAGNATPREGLILVTGSLYLAGEALAVYRPGRNGQPAMVPNSEQFSLDPGSPRKSL
ncbi:MAG: hypothetical protein LBU64_04850 [Planctomycetota bacterium]|jgi:dihydrofolate synthase/folylpolyglutamate synthase|nr:hypothetical protein [Planctomycetota bacterium]